MRNGSCSSRRTTSYTTADVEAHGNTIPAVKYNGIRPSHDSHPKHGQKICPISEIMANPKFTWVIGGNTYEFCRITMAALNGGGSVGWGKSRTFAHAFQGRGGKRREPGAADGVFSRTPNRPSRAPNP